MTMYKKIRLFLESRITLHKIYVNILIRIDLNTKTLGSWKENEVAGFIVFSQ